MQNTSNQLSLWSAENRVPVDTELGRVLKVKQSEKDGNVTGVTVGLQKRTAREGVSCGTILGLSGEQLDREYLRLADLFKSAIMCEAVAASSSDTWTGVSMRKTKSRLVVTLGTKDSIVKCRAKIPTVEEAIMSLLRRGFDANDIAEMVEKVQLEQAEAVDVASEQQQHTLADILQPQPIDNAKEPLPSDEPPPMSEEEKAMLKEIEEQEALKRKAATEQQQQ